MVFNMMDTRLFVGASALVLIGLAVVFFGLALILHIASLVKGRYGGKGGAGRAQEPDVNLISARLNRGAALVEFFGKAGERVGYALVRDEWNGAALPRLHLLPSEAAAAEVHPLRLRDVGVLSTVIDSVTRKELALLGTIYKKAGRTSAPKPIYDLDGNVVLEFKEVESAGGLTSAKLVDATGKRVGSIYATGPNAWTMEYAKDVSMDLRVLMLAFAQLIGEEEK